MAIVMAELINMVEDWVSEGRAKPASLRVVSSFKHWKDSSFTSCIADFNDFFGDPREVEFIQSDVADLAKQVSFVAVKASWDQDEIRLELQ